MTATSAGEPAYLKPLPRPDKLTAPFWEGCKQGELRLQRCANCGAYRLPPRPICAQCLSHESEWVASGGRGRVWSWTIIHPPVLPAFQDDVPYSVVVVELDEGVRLVSNLVDVPAAEIRADLPVQVVFEPVTEDVTLPKFKRAAPP
jgi:uncharacterized OB-fold protein